MPYIGKKPANIIATAVDTTTGTFSGDIDVDGTTNLDVVDIDGAVNVAADVTIASTNKIIFNDASQFIHAPSATVLDIAATDTIELTATTTAIVGNQTVSGTLGVTGIATFTDDIIIGDGKTIGSASDVDAMTIASNGQVTFTQTLIGTALDISGDIDVDGITNLDVVDIDGAVNMASTVLNGGPITISSGSYFIGNSTNGFRFNNAADGQTLFYIKDSGEAVFNDNSIDYDFRVESDTSSHALFLNSAELLWGINRTDPQKTLEISSNLEQLRLSTASEPTNYYTDISSLYDSANPFRMRGYYNGTTVDFIEITAAGGFANPILKLGEGMSYVSLYIGTTEHVVLQATGLAINETGADADFRVESDNDANALFVDGADGTVTVSKQFNTSSATSKIGHTSQATAISGTTNTTIVTAINAGFSSAAAAQIIVYGSDNSSRAFMDTLNVLSSGAVVVVQSSTLAGSPHGRTYAISGANLNLQLASGASGYNVNCSVTTLNHPF